MLMGNVVAAVSCLITVFTCLASAMPEPAIYRERHIIHAPIKFKIIHHYKIKKVPVVIKKHLHYHKPQIESKPEYHQDDHYRHLDDHSGIPHHPEYEDDQQQSQEEEYDDYEYE